VGEGAVAAEKWGKKTVNKRSSGGFLPGLPKSAGVKQNRRRKKECSRHGIAVYRGGDERTTGWCGLEKTGKETLDTPS